MTSILLWGGVSYYPASGERLRELTAPGSNSPQTTIQGVRGNRPRGDEEQQGDHQQEEDSRPTNVWCPSSRAMMSKTTIAMHIIKLLVVSRLVYVIE